MDSYRLPFIDFDIATSSTLITERMNLSVLGKRIESPLMFRRETEIPRRAKVRAQCSERDRSRGEGGEAGRRGFSCTPVSVHERYTHIHDVVHTRVVEPTSRPAKESSRSRYEIASECRLSGSDKSGTSATVYLATAPSRSWARPPQIKSDNEGVKGRDEREIFSSSSPFLRFPHDLRAIVPKERKKKHPAASAKPLAKPRNSMESRSIM